MGSSTMSTRGSDQSGTKDERLNLRVTAQEKRLLERAAQATHASATQFILRSALISAEDVLAAETRFALPAEQWGEFTALLDRPARVVPALARAASKPSPFRGE